MQCISYYKQSYSFLYFYRVPLLLSQLCRIYSCSMCVWWSSYLDHPHAWVEKDGPFGLFGDFLILVEVQIVGSVPLLRQLEISPLKRLEKRWTRHKQGELRVCYIQITWDGLSKKVLRAWESELRAGSPQGFTTRSALGTGDEDVSPCGSVVKKKMVKVPSRVPKEEIIHLG